MNSKNSGEGVLRHAFLNQYNLILVGGAILFAVALSSRLPLIAAAVGEALWLAVGAWTPGFKSWVAGQSMRKEEEQWAAESESAAQGLDAPSAARVRKVGRTAGEIWSSAIERNLESQFGLGGREKLGAVVQAFARMASVHQRLSRFMGDGRTSGVEDELVRLGQSLADEKDPAVRLSLRQALAVGQRRLKQLEQIESTRRTLEVKMATLEMSFEYIRSQVFGGAGEDELTSALDEMVSATGFIADVEAETSASLQRMRIAPATRVLGPSAGHS
jgi:hypothetical protein